MIVTFVLIMVKIGMVRIVTFVAPTLLILVCQVCDTTPTHVIALNYVFFSNYYGVSTQQCPVISSRMENLD